MPDRTGMDLGEAMYPDRVRLGEQVFFGGGRRFRVLDVVIYDEEDESPFVGLLQVEAAELLLVTCVGGRFLQAQRLRCFPLPGERPGGVRRRRPPRRTPGRGAG